MLDQGLAGRGVLLVGLLLRELEWNDARNGSKNLNAAPSRRRPHACLDPHSLCVAARGRSNIRPLLEARALAAQPPGWAAIFVKAFSLVAKDEPVLRTLYVEMAMAQFL